MQTSELPLFNNMHIKYVICSNDFMCVYIIQEDNANCIVKANMKKHERDQEIQVDYKYCSIRLGVHVTTN